MISTKATKAVADTALKLATRKAKGSEEQALLGALVGALYALQKAVSIGFVDHTGDALPEDYSDELARVASQLANGAQVAEAQWLAGFYFNSAIHRLAALNERLTTYIFGCKKDVCGELRKDNNKFKHNIEGLLAGRHVGLEQATAAASQLGNVLFRLLDAS